MEQLEMMMKQNLIQSGEVQGAEAIDLLTNKKMIMSNELSKSKIRNYIKLLKKKNENYTFRQAYDLICSQIKQEEAFNEDDMEGVKDEVWTRLEENWPFNNKI